MDLGFVGQSVIAQDFGYSVALNFSGGYEVRIETTVLLCVDGVDHEITPGAEIDTHHVAKLMGRVVAVAEADEGGELRIDFQDGARVLAAADEDYEAWTLAGPGGLKVVSGPGGGLSVWSPAN